MPIEDDELLTEDQDVDGEQDQSDNQDSDPEGHSSDDESASRQRKPFLVVDERTQYATKDEAVRAYSEAGKRIAALSAWEKELKDYGELTPAEVREFLDELIESRQSVAQMKSQLENFKQERDQAAKQPQAGSGDATRVAGEQKMTREEKEAVEWLKDKLPSLGYISKEDAMKLIGELQAKTQHLERFDNFMSEQNERYRQTLVADSQAKLKTMMAEDGFEDDEDGSLQIMIENNIRAYIEADSRRMDKFYQGGAVKDQVVRDAYERATKALGRLKSTSSATLAKNKVDALRRNGRSKLPTQNTISGKPLKKGDQSGKSSKRFNSSGKRDFIGEKHNEAWEIASRHFSNEGNGE